MTDAVEVAIEAALLERLAAFGTANSIDVAYPNVAFTAPAPSPTAKYLRATFLPAETVSLGIGFTSSRNQHVGLLQVDVFHGQGKGELAPGRIAADLIAYFKRGTTVTRDGFRAQVTRAPYRIQAIKDDPWLIVPVRVPYLCLASNPA